MTRNAGMAKSREETAIIGMGNQGSLYGLSSISDRPLVRR